MAKWTQARDNWQSKFFFLQEYVQDTTCATMDVGEEHYRLTLISLTPYPSLRDPLSIMLDLIVRCSYFVQNFVIVYTLRLWKSMYRVSMSCFVFLCVRRNEFVVSVCTWLSWLTCHTFDPNVCWLY